MFLKTRRSMKIFMSCTLLGVGGDLAVAQTPEPAPDIETVPAAKSGSGAELETIERAPREPNYPPGTGPVTLLHPAGLLFATYDSDRDLMVSLDELRAGQQRSFTRADKNKDQNLSLFELEDWRIMALGNKDAMPGNLGFDSNFNRVISPEEFSAELQRIFDHADSDDDKKLSFSELVRVVERSARDTRPPSLLGQENSNQPYQRRGRR